MRIAMVGDEFYPDIGGGSLYATELSRALAKLGAEPVVIIHAHPGQRAEEEIDGVGVRRLKGFVVPGLNRGASAGLFRRLHLCIKHGGFDVVHGQDLYSPMSMMSIHSAKKRKIPSVITCHSIHESKGLWKLIYQPVVFTLRRANRVIAVSKASERFCHELEVPAYKTVVIPNGVDLSKFNPRVDGSSMRKRLGIKDEPLVATAIRLVKRKGPQHLLVAFSKVLAIFPEAKLVMAGRGPEAKSLRAQIERLGMEGSASMVGGLPRGEVARLMAAADVFVLPSVVEASPLAALEAMALGTPVVCPGAGGIPEIISNGSNGLLFEPRDENSMADAILRALTDKRLVRCLREKGMKTAQGFSWETAARRTLGVYEEIRWGKIPSSSPD